MLSFVRLCHDYLNVMLSVVRLNVIMLSVVASLIVGLEFAGEVRRKRSKLINIRLG